MKINPITPDYKGYRFPPAIISHAVWLYFRFSLSFRDVEELLAQRGIVVALVVETNGIWTRFFSRSMGSSTICGVQWISMATCWIYG
jgi:putative transposase